MILKVFFSIYKYIEIFSLLLVLLQLKPVLIGPKKLTGEGQYMDVVPQYRQGHHRFAGCEGDKKFRPACIVTKQVLVSRDILQAQKIQSATALQLAIALQLALATRHQSQSSTEQSRGAGTVSQLASQVQVPTWSIKKQARKKEEKD